MTGCGSKASRLGPIAQALYQHPLRFHYNIIFSTSRFFQKPRQALRQPLHLPISRIALSATPRSPYLKSGLTTQESPTFNDNYIPTLTPFGDTKMSDSHLPDYIPPHLRGRSNSATLRIQGPPVNRQTNDSASDGLDALSTNPGIGVGDDGQAQKGQGIRTTQSNGPDGEGPSASSAGSISNPAVGRSETVFSAGEPLLLGNGNSNPAEDSQAAPAPESGAVAVAGPHASPDEEYITFVTSDGETVTRTKKHQKTLDFLHRACFICHKRGHKAYQCPDRPPTPEPEEPPVVVQEWVNGLPDDILLASFEFLERTDLVSVIRVCKRFRRLARTLVFRDITRLSDERHQLLCRSIEEDRSLATSIHACSIKLNDFGWPCTDVETDCLLLHHLTNLRHLEVLRNARDGLGEPLSRPAYQLGWLDLPEFSEALHGVRSMKLYGEYIDDDGDLTFCRSEFTATELLRVMLLPNMRSIHARCIANLYDEIPEAFKNKASNLMSLHISSSHIPSRGFATLIKACPKLRKLVSNIPVFIPRGSGVDPEKETINPADLSWILEPVKSTLEEFSCLSRNHWRHWDTLLTVMDFSDFSTLKKIHITGFYHFPDRTRFDCNIEAREGVYKLFPKSLEYLEVSP